MIISPLHRFALVHIPKCAGTSVRHQLRTTDPDHIFLGQPGDHPVLGRIDYAHIPLATLRQHFSKEYSLLRDYDSFALVRDPLERFGSSLRQLLWQYEKRPMTLIPQDELRDLTLRMLDEVAGQIDAPSVQYVFFTRQSDFIFDHGEQIIDHVLPVALVPQMLDYFASRTGVALDRDRRSNQNVELRYKGVGRAAYAVNSFIRKRLPAGLHGRLKSAALRVIAKPTSAAEASGILDLPEVRDFVAHHYAADRAIFDAVRAHMPALRTGLACGDLPRTELPVLAIA